MNLIKNTIPASSLFLILFLMSCTGKDQYDQAEEASNDAAQSEFLIDDPYESRTSINHKEELVFIYIDSPNIRQYNDSTLVKTIVNLKNRVSEKADSLNMGFLAMGVAISWNVDEGYDHLRRFGFFDEILTGNNWFGTGGLKYIFEDIQGRPVLPQVLLTRRIYNADESEDGSVSNLQGVESEELILRYMGDHNIEQWLNNGASLTGM